jgi:hypothetical protein
MKKIITLLIFSAVLVLSLQAQKVSNYAYKLDNGITVRTEQCWNQVWVSQSFAASNASDPTPLALNVRTLGDLTVNTSFKLFAAGKEVKTQGAKPGIYLMKVSGKLTGKPGTINFDIGDIEIKAKNKTAVSVILYDYQVNIEEVPGSLKGVSAYSSTIERYKGTIDMSPSSGIPAFYVKGARDKPVPPEETTGNKKGKIKPGTYDLLITPGVPGRAQKVWLENFTMKPDVTYNITLNLNAGVIEYAGGIKDVKAIHLYPAGVADRQKGTAAPDRDLEIMKCDGFGSSSSCPPGTYDVLLNHNNGAKYEWKKNIAVTTGRKTQVK